MSSSDFIRMHWSIEDMNEAEPAGWNVFLFWDNGNMGLVIQREVDDKGNGIFPNDEAARQFVAMAAKAGNEVAQRAVKAVFLSRVGSKSKESV